MASGAQAMLQQQLEAAVMQTVVAAEAQVTYTLCHPNPKLKHVAPFVRRTL